MGKVIKASFPKQSGSSGSFDEFFTKHNIRKAKDTILGLSNELQHKYGHFKATAAGNPTLVYGQGHDMKKHGEGKPYDDEE